MSISKKSRVMLAGLTAGLLVGAGVSVLTPAGAAVQNAAAAINWSNIWKTQIKPRADKRYYTKTKANKKFAPKPGVIRGTFIVAGTATAGGQVQSSDAGFGFTFSAPPTVHIIAPAAVPPAGCSGTLASPNADPGHLCIFERVTINGSLTVCSATNACGPSASAYGAWLLNFSNAAGYSEVSGSWAARPLGITTARVKAPSVGSPGAAGR